MMSGNCATGSDLIATSPPNTVMMAITIATIGRSIKIREIILTTALQRNETRIHSDAGPDFLRAFNHDPFTGFQTVVDNPKLVDLLADFNRTNTHLVVVANDGDLITALQLRHGALRYHQRVVLRARDRANAAKLSRTKNVAGIRKHAREPNRARLRIDLPIGEEKPSLFRIRRAVGENQIELQLRDARAGLRVDQISLGEREILLFVEREIDFDRIDCGDCRQRRAVVAVRADQVSDLRGRDAR